MALVDWVGEMQIRCRWFYRYAELPAHLRKAVSDCCCCEVFLSSHQDLNDMSSVIQTCTVARKPVDGPVGTASPAMLIDDHLVCRYVYDIPKKSISLVSDWRDSHVAFVSDGTATSTHVASQDCATTAAHSQQPHVVLDGTFFHDRTWMTPGMILLGLRDRAVCVLAGALAGVSPVKESRTPQCAEHHSSLEGSRHDLSCKSSGEETAPIAARPPSMDFSRLRNHFPLVSATSSSRLFLH